MITGDTYDNNNNNKSLINKALNHMCPPNITSMFQIANNKNYNDKMLMLPKPETNAMKRSYSYAVAGVWNSRIKNRS